MTSIHQPYFIGIAGGTGSGKTTLAEAIMSKVGRDRVSYIAYDDYYKDLSHIPFEERFGVNFDHPDALDTLLLVQHLDELSVGRAIESPEYDFLTCTRRAEMRRVEPREVIIVDGILALVDDALVSRFDLRIYMDLDADERVMRRLERDVVTRGRSVESVLKQYRDSVRPMHDQFVEPSKNSADIFVPGRRVDGKALEAIAGQVVAKIQTSRIDALQTLGMRLLSGSQEIGTVINEIVVTAGQELGADNVTLHQFNATTGKFLDPDTYSATWPHEGKLDPPREDGITATVAKEGTKIIEDVDNVTHEAGKNLVNTEHLTRTGTKAFLGIRLQAAGESVGVLFFNYARPRTFGSDEQALANVFAAYAATAIQLHRTSDRLRELGDVARSLLSADLATVQEQIVRLAQERLGSNNAVLHQYDSRQKQFLDPELHSAAYPAYAKLEKPRESGLSALVITEGILEVSNPDTSPYAELFATNHLTKTGTRAFLGARLGNQEEPLGVLFCNYTRSRKFTAEERALFNVLSVYASAAVSAARTVSLRSEAQQAEHRRIVQGISNAMQVTRDLPDFLQSLLDLILGGIGAPKGTIQLLDKKTNELEIVAERGLERKRTESRIPVGVGITGLAAKLGTLQYVPDVLSVGGNIEYLPYLGRMRSELAMPLKVGERVLGVLNAEHTTPHAFDREKRELFELITDQAAIAIDQKLNLDDEIRRRQEAEKKALLIDITLDMQHFIGNKVGIIRLSAMELLKQLRLSNEESQLQSTVQTILDNAVTALNSSRHILELRKPPVRQMIKPDSLINEMLGHGDLAPTIRLHVDVPSTLPSVFVDRDRVEYSLRDLVVNAQRAILNSERASGLITISGALSDDGRYVELIFSNDGPPIHESQRSRLFQGPGFGLPTARALLNSLSGSIELLSSTVGQTSFLVRLPVDVG